MRVGAARGAHHREGHELFTVDPVIAEEQRIFELVDAADARARLDVRAADLEGLSGDQARAIASIAASPYLVQPLQAPAGAGKTHSLQALRAAAQRTNKAVLVLAPTGKAVDEAMRGGAGDRGVTVAKALHLIGDDQLRQRGADGFGPCAAEHGLGRRIELADSTLVIHAHDSVQRGPKDRFETPIRLALAILGRHSSVVIVALPSIADSGRR